MQTSRSATGNTGRLTAYVTGSAGASPTRPTPMVRDLGSRTRLLGSATRNTGLYIARILRLACAAGTYVSGGLIRQLASSFPQHRTNA
jgi:hypothetical protein